jgi:PKD repeat protein
MKNIIYVALAFSVIILSCQSSPQAFFSADTTTPDVGQPVYFTNDSKNAKSFKWDFGDGYASTDVNPSHVYEGTGTFEVKMSALSKNGLEDISYLSIQVMVPTLLEIEVVEYYDLYIVKGASVLLYSSITDWDAQTNKVSEGFTDDNGIVVFSGLGPWVYYVDVWEKNHNNYTLKTEDLGFIRTSEIWPHKINRFTAYVDYVATAKGDGRVTQTAVIKKLERKASDKQQPASNSGTEGWQELYNKSIKLK